MQYDEKIHRITIFIVMFGIAMSVLIVVILSHNAFAQSGQTLHDRTLYEVVEQTSGMHDNAQIAVGDRPTAIAITGLDTFYVVNSDSNTVSVISTENNTKIKDIPVGAGPHAIAISPFSSVSASIISNIAYVANSGSNTVSVISGNDEKIKDIPVGDSPMGMAVNYDLDIIYVANSDSNTVSVISTETNEKIVGDIRVGDSPTDIVVNQDTDTVYVLNTGSSEAVNGSLSVISNNTKIEDIPVGIGPRGIDINQFSYEVYVYVINELSNSTSVISTENNTKIKDIPVGDSPTDVGIDDNTVYVANSGSNTVSVISTENNTKIKDIPVGAGLHAMALNPISRILYVVNLLSDSVSVISTENNTKIKDIPVGDSPMDIGGDGNTNTVYVANSGSDSVSVIDSDANEVVAGVTFQLHPFNSGYIVCDDLSTASKDDLTPPSPVGQYIYVYSGSECTAKPNEGFGFVSWEETNLDDNSTQPISVSHPAPILDSIANFMDPDPIAERWDSLFKSWGMQPIPQSLGLNPYESKASTLNITKFGTFTANFKEAPAPLPPEFWAQMYAVIATVITAFFIPSIVGWFKSKRDAKKLDNYYHKQTASLYQDGEIDEKDIEALDDLRNRIENAYPEGKLNEKHYESLRGEISTLYEEIFRKKIAALDGKNSDSVVKKPMQEQLAQIRSEIKYAFSKGKINEKHYALLNEDILKLDGKESNTTS